MQNSHPSKVDGPAGPPPGETAPPFTSEASVRQAVESSTDCIKVLSLDGSLEYMNEGGLCVMEIEDFGAFRGACWPDFWQGEEHAKALAALEEARAGGVGRFQGFAATAKGNVRYWDVTVSPVPGPDGGVERLLSVSRDVTAQRQAEMERDRLLDALHEERRKLWSLFEQAPAAAAVLEGEGLVFGFASRRYRELFTGGKDVVGRPLAEVLPEACEQGFDGRLRQVMATGETFRHPETAFTTYADDGSQRTVYVDFVYQPIREPDGAASGVFANIVDVTDQVLAREALRRANGELESRVAERTELLEEAVREAEGFNYSIAHDLRTPLRAMVSTSGILLEELGPELGEEHRVLLARQSDNAVRLGRLIDELLRLSRFSRAEVNRRALDMTAKARSVFDDLEADGRTNGCRLETQEGMAAEGDAGLVRTVLHNLIGNACKFSPRGGTVRVGEEGGVFSVADEGVGFDMAFAHKLFLPFERLVTEAQFEGTGIGLANVERIVKRHGGRVWAESEGAGKGATFYFTLG